MSSQDLRDQIIEAERRFRDEQGQHYEDRMGFDREALDACLACLLQIEPGQTVVDAGCGTGRWLPRLTAARAEVVAVDHSEGFLEIARSRVPDAERHLVELRQGDVRELPVETGTVDWVISSEVLQLIPGEDNRIRMLEESRRVLRPGGALALSTYRWRGHVKRRKEGFWGQDSKTYRYAFTPKELERLLTSAGFVDVNVRGAVIAPYLSERLGMSVETAVRLSLSPLSRYTADFLVARARNPS